VLAGASSGGPIFAETSNFFSSCASGQYGSYSAYLSAVSCAEGLCLAEGLTAAFDGGIGGGWTERSTSSGDQVLGDFCVSDLICATVGDDASGFTRADEPGQIYLTTAEWTQEWLSESLPSDAGPLDGITCAPDSTLCLAVGEKYGTSGAEILLDSGDPLSYAGLPTVPDAASQGGGGGDGRGACDCSVGGPVLPEDGDFYASSTDVSVPTGYGPPLDFTRTYDAEAAQSSSSAGQLGYGWTDNWAANLSIDDDTGEVTYTQANGAQFTYVPPSDSSCPTGEVDPSADYASGSYCAAPYVLGALTYDSDAEQYTLTVHPDTTYVFDDTGQLLSVADAEGDTDTSPTAAPRPARAFAPNRPARA
jgi:hypothetical protein